jgi:hypothetical protein
MGENTGRRKESNECQMELTMSFDLHSRDETKHIMLMRVIDRCRQNIENCHEQQKMWTNPDSNRRPPAVSAMLSGCDNQLHHMPHVTFGNYGYLDQNYSFLNTDRS